jgi:hypothetical protein
MTKNLRMTMIVASLIALVVLATLLLTGIGAATVRSGKTIEIPYGSFAHASGTNLYCEYLNGTTGVPAFNCFVAQGTGSHPRVAGSTYLVLFDHTGVTVDKMNAGGTGFKLTKAYTTG